MSKPEDIPQDVWDIAMDIYDSAAFQIAHAIMDEREACAQLAIAETKATAQRNAKDQWVEQIGQRLCHAIRSRS